MSAHETEAAAESAATAGAAAYPRRWLAAVVMIGAVLNRDAGLLRRSAGFLPDLRGVAPDRHALLAAGRRAHRPRLQRRKHPAGAGRGTARAALRPVRAVRWRAAARRRDRHHQARRRA